MYLPWTKLPFCFEPGPLRSDVHSLGEKAWIPHFNTSDFEGQWSSVSLRSLSGRSDDILPLGSPEDFRDTPLLASMPAVRAVLDTFQMPFKSIRLLRLHGGSRVKEHVDSDLGLSRGELRIHVPILTSTHVEFIVNNRRLMLNAGESWYIDFSQPHRIVNRGTEPRIHLIMDGVVNQWAMEMLQKSARDIVTESFKPEGVTQLEAFCEHVYVSASLRTHLMSVRKSDELARETVEAGRLHGFQFETDDVLSLQKAHRREWNLRTL